jgi:hypothetical protein
MVEKKSKEKTKTYGDSIINKIGRLEIAFFIWKAPCRYHEKLIRFLI